MPLRIATVPLVLATVCLALSHEDATCNDSVPIEQRRIGMGWTGIAHKLQNLQMSLSICCVPPALAFVLQEFR